MTLYKLVQDVCNLGKSSPNVNFVTQGDIYQLNHNQDVEYPAFVVTQGTHTGSDYDEEQFTLTLFAVDRLVSDKSNEIDVQSWANGVLLDVIKKIGDFYIGTVQSGFKIQTFTEKFDSLCAGAYVTLAINVENMDCDCGSKSIGFVTSVNGQTGDITIKGYEGAVVSSVNGQTGDVYLNIPTKVSELKNDSDYASESFVNTKVKNVSTYISNNYYTKEYQDSNFVSGDNFDEKLSDYYTKEESNDLYLMKGDVPELDSYVKKELFEAKVFEIDSSIFDVSTRLNNYIVSNDAEEEKQKAMLDDHESDISEITNDLQGKQEVLYSGINIKKINGIDILGEGNIIIAGGEGSTSVDHINLTLKEYEALSDEDKMNGAIYCITDIVYVEYSEYAALEKRVEALEAKINELMK